MSSHGNYSTEFIYGIYVAMCLIIGLGFFCFKHRRYKLALFFIGIYIPVLHYAVKGPFANSMFLVLVFSSHYLLVPLIWVLLLWMACNIKEIEHQDMSGAWFKLLFIYLGPVIFDRTYKRRLSSVLFLCKKYFKISGICFFIKYWQIIKNIYIPCICYRSLFACIITWVISLLWSHCWSLLLFHIWSIFVWIVWNIKLHCFWVLYSW